jgi:hypothetical protein
MSRTAARSLPQGLRPIVFLQVTETGSEPQGRFS